MQIMSHYQLSYHQTPLRTHVKSLNTYLSCCTTTVPLRNKEWIISAFILKTHFLQKWNMIILIYFNQFSQNQINVVLVVSQGNSSNLKPIKYKMNTNKVNRKSVDRFSE